MGYNQNPDDEVDAAASRIDQIVSGGGAAAPQRDRYQEESLDEVRSDALDRARGRAGSARSRLGLDEPQPKQQSRARASGGEGGTARTQQAIMLIGGLVVAGIVIVAIVLFAFGQGGAALPFLATATPTPTDTPTPTPTLTPTPTVPADLVVPGLACIFQTTGCAAYCAQPENITECNTARANLEGKGVNADVFFQCLAETPMSVETRVIDCLHKGYYAKLGIP
jgi:hypothetical protein